MSTHLQVIALDRVVYEDDVDVVIAPGVEGQLGLLPRHAPIMTLLETGELLIRKGSQEMSMAVTGGFLQVYPDLVVVLADAAERSEEIDIQRAEAARLQAEELLRESRHAPNVDLSQAEASLRRSLIRLKVTERLARRRGGPSRGL